MWLLFHFISNGCHLFYLLNDISKIIVGIGKEKIPSSCRQMLDQEALNVCIFSTCVEAAKVHLSALVSRVVHAPPSVLFIKVCQIHKMHRGEVKISVKIAAQKKEPLLMK